MSQDYDALESQIGDAGGEENKPKLGKIQHKEILGQKGDLDADEQASLEAFKKRGAVAREEHAAANISDGWLPVDRTEMGPRSDFYPPEWEFFIHPASVMAIKNWTAVDEERADQVQRVMNEIIRTSVRIDTHSSTPAGWSRINSWDRFWFILKVREATFAYGESKIEFEDACSECDSDITYTLTSDSLFYEYPDEDLVDKYWDGEKWTIDPREYGVDHEPVVLYTPTLGKDDAIIEWATAKARSKQKIDENFVNYLMWLIPKAIKDQAAMERQIEKIYKQYKSWTIEMYDFMTDVIRNLTINPSEQLRCICPHCGQEATSTVQFPNGIQTLFRVESKVKKFGTR